MYVRLAFAVAAYLEPEILIVDEVLAVGDAQFQKKCLGKMEDVGKEGRTVLFVSHNLGFLQRLCSCSILLDKGTVVGHDTTKTIVYKYENLLYQDTSSSKNILERKDRKGRGRVRISEVEVFSEDMKNTAILGSGSSASFIVHFTPANKNLSCSFTIYNSNNYPISHFNSFISGSEDIYDTNSQGKFICEIDHLLLTPGTYKVNIAITSSSGHELEDHLEGAIFFEIVQGIIKGRPLDKDSGFGNTHLPHRWIIPS
jgi:lipopolysaccharide transport system ATP-binding protein